MTVSRSPWTKRNGSARDRGRVDRLRGVEERDPAAHQAGHRREAVRRARGVQERARAAVAEAGDRHAVGVHVELGEQLGDERLDGRRRLVFPPHPVGLREHGQLLARLERRARGLRGGDRAAGPAPEHDDQREGLVAAVVLGHVEDVRAAAEALGAHEPQRGARHLAGRALGEERLPAPARRDRARSTRAAPRPSARRARGGRASSRRLRTRGRVEEARRGRGRARRGARGEPRAAPPPAGARADGARPRPGRAVRRSASAPSRSA